MSRTFKKPATRRPALASAPARWDAGTVLADKWVLCGLLVLLVLAVFFPARKFEFVNYDDSDYVTANRHVLTGVSAENLRWAFVSGHASNWHPVTWISHQLDCQFFGGGPEPAHFVNLGLHAVNAMLIFLVLRSLTGTHWRSAVVAALFAVHPLRAESVAWVSERKDVLSGFFFLLTLWAYARYVRSPDAAAASWRRAGFWYAIALLCFAMGLMSKPMLVTVPFVLLLLDYWPLARVNSTGIRATTKLMLEKIPFLILSLGSSVITFFVQRTGGAVSTVLPLGDRIGNAIVSYARYLAKTVCPIDLSVLYPHPGHWPLWEVTGAAFVLILVTTAALARWRRYPFLLVGWFWFLGMLVPVIGLVQVGIQSMADRYTYLPGIGLMIMIVWGTSEWFARQKVDETPARFVAGSAILLCSIICRHQLQYWQDSQTLFQRAINVTRNNYLAYNNLGYYFSGKGQLEKAKTNYIKSLEINPRYPDALNNLGFALAGEGNYAQAIPYYEAALRVSPLQPDIHNNLGNALSESGNVEPAIEQYLAALRIDPTHAEANNNLGIALAMQGHLDQAVDHFKAAIHTKPEYAGAHSNLGNAYAAKHQIGEAIAEYQTCLQINPKDAQAHNNLGNAFMEQGKTELAIDQYSEALRLNSANPEAQFNLGLACLRLNRRSEAATHFQAVLQLNPANTEARRQLDLLSR